MDLGTNSYSLVEDFIECDADYLFWFFLSNLSSESIHIT